MKTYHKRLALFLIGLFLAFSFNAYACVVPVYPDVSPTQGRDCTMPGEEPVSQFCDGFKTLAVQSGADISSSNLSNLVLAVNLYSVFSNPVATSPFLLTPPSQDPSPPRDIQVLISVFRI
jgi:hypothetical protein